MNTLTKEEIEKYLNPYQPLINEAEKFKHSRIKKILLDNQSPFQNLQTKTSLFIHIIPFDFLARPILDVTIFRKYVGEMKPIFSAGWDFAYNNDGFATFFKYNGQIISYDQVFRNGVYEIYANNIVAKEQINGEEHLLINGEDIIYRIWGKLKSTLGLMKNENINCPLIILFSLNGIVNSAIKYELRWSFPFTIDRLEFSPIIIHNELEPVDLYKTIKLYFFDPLFQTVGVENSPTFSI